jgi:hypothetical protein
MALEFLRLTFELAFAFAPALPMRAVLLHVRGGTYGVDPTSCRVVVVDQYQQLGSLRRGIR